MKITSWGKELDPAKEHEIIFENEFGAKIQITFKKSYYGQHKNIVVNNCTEFHWRYNKNDFMERVKGAFESDIHGTGFNREVNDFESVVITKQESLADKFVTF